METTIEKRIYILRGERVMLDSDLAELYGIETKVLKQQVRRNIERFPDDFMFECTFSELASLRSQIVTLEPLTLQKHMTHQPFVFTENGVAMLSSVLSSPRAVQVNIAIMRAFTKLRSYFMLGNDRVNKLEQHTAHLFKVVFERLDGIEEAIEPRLPRERKKIGLKAKRET